MHSKLIGQRLPRAQLCEMLEGQLRVLEAGPIFGRGLVLLVDMPGAYTPICACRHLPSLPKKCRLYLLIVRDGAIETVRVEESILDLN